MTRVIGESSNLKRIVDICIYESKTSIGISLTDCDPQGVGSNTMFGATQGVAIATNTGVPFIAPANIGLTPTIRATFGNIAMTNLKATPAGQIIWSRSVNESWVCSSLNIAAKYRSISCP